MANCSFQAMNWRILFLSFLGGSILFAQIGLATPLPSSEYSQPQAGTTGSWHTAIRLDSVGGNHATPAISPSGDLWVFYTINDDSTETLVRRKRERGDADFDDETLVYNTVGRTANPLFLDEDDIWLAVQDREKMRLLLSADGGSTWDQDRYWIAADSPTCPAYLPSFLTADGSNLHLSFNFTHNTGIFGCVTQLRFLEKRGGSWIHPSLNFGTSGRIHRVFEEGDNILIVEQRGVWRSSDNGVSFEKTPDLGGITGTTQDENGILYLARSYYYGLPPDDNHLQILRSADFGLTWSPVLSFDAPEIYFRPKIAVTEDIMVIVWASNDSVEVNTLDQIHAMVSTDAGQTWSDPTSIVTYDSGYETPSIAELIEQYSLDAGEHTFFVKAIDSRDEESAVVQTTFTIGAEADDADGDGLSREDEELLGTDPNRADTDGDEINDGQEILDGSNPLDLGSFLPLLGSTICSEWNGFLGGMHNIVEHVNLSNSSLQVNSTLHDILGAEQDYFAFDVDPGQQWDLLVHDMDGRIPNSYGKVCSTHSGSSGDLDGRMVYYKPDDDSYAFAFSMPFQKGLAGDQFVQFNTFQPSFDPFDYENIVANWIQITNLEDSSESGFLFFYGIDGTELGSEPLTLRSGARADRPGHQFGRDRVGLVAWKPEDNNARFQLRNVRYFYDNPFGVETFDAAFQLEGRRGNGEVLVF